MTYACTSNMNNILSFISLIFRTTQYFFQLGINHTFCMPDADEPVTGASSGTENGETPATRKNQRGPFFASPIVQAHHFQLAPDFIEVASATGKERASNEKANLMIMIITFNFLTHAWLSLCKLKPFPFRNCTKRAKNSLLSFFNMTIKLVNIVSMKIDKKDSNIFRPSKQGLTCFLLLFVILNPKGSNCI